MNLFDLVFPPREDEVILRNICDDDFLTLMAPRLIPYTQPGTVALFSFEKPSVRAAIHEAKYHGNKRSFQLLGSALVEYLADADDIHRTEFSHGDSNLRLNLVVLVPVPLGRERFKKRGFNQSEEMTKLAALHLNGACTMDTTLIERIRETTSQISLPRHKRKENMLDAFKTVRALDPAHTYIIIDDVITTGATLQAAICTLKKAGAKHIIPLALAH